MLKIVSPPTGVTLGGNVPITCTMLNPAMATKANFKVNGTTFATVDPALTMNASLHTLSLGLPDGNCTVTVQTTGTVYTASRTISVNNATSIFVHDVAGHMGDYVPVQVKLNKFSSAAKCQFTLEYDESKLQLDESSVIKGSGVPLASTLNKSTSPGLLTVTISGTSHFTSSELVIAHFQIRSFSAVGTANGIDVIDVSANDVSDNPITTLGVKGYVTTD